MFGLVPACVVLAPTIRAMVTLPLRRLVVVAALLTALVSPVTVVSQAAPLAPQDVAVNSLTLALSPQSIAVDGTGTYGYVVTYQTHEVFKVRLSDFSIDDSMTLPPDPGGTPYAGGRAVALYGGNVYVTTSSALYKLDATNLPDSPDDSVAIDAFGQGMAISWPYAYVTHHVANLVSKVDLSTMTVVGTLASGGTYPMGISVDDTYAYVVNTISSSLSRIRLSDFTAAGSVVVGQQPYGVAVNPTRTYALVPTASDSSWGVTNPPWLVRVDLSTFTVDDTVALPFTWGYGVAITPNSTAAYVTQSRGGNQVAKVALGAHMTLDGATIAVGSGPQDVVVNPVLPYFYTTDFNDTNGTTITKVAIGSGVAAPSVASLSVSSGPLGGGGQVTISGSDLDGASAVHFGATSATIISGTDDTVLVTVPAVGSAGAGQVTVTTPGGTSTDNVQYTYVAAPHPTDMSPSTGPTLGGTTVAVTGTDLSGATVTLGGSPVALDVNTGTSIQFTTPSGAAGAWDVSVTTVGGTTSAGSFTYVAPPVPVAPGPVPSVSAVPGDSSATVSWRPPHSVGSFAVSTYQVRATPGGASCLTATLSCAVRGLANGTAYRFTVRALSGAGWGAWSDSSAAVTPSESSHSISLTGERKGKRIVLSGTATPGALVQPWVRLGVERSFAPTQVSATAGADGTFTWSRRTSRSVEVYVTTTAGRSETIAIHRR